MSLSCWSCRFLRGKLCDRCSTVAARLENRCNPRGTVHGKIVKVMQLVRTARCPCCAGRAGFPGAGCDDGSRDPTVASR